MKFATFDFVFKDNCGAYLFKASDVVPEVRFD